MNRIKPIIILLAAYLAVFCGAAFDGFRKVLGAQIDLLPSILVYAGLSTGVLTIAGVAFLSGLWHDALSANPLGVSVLPLLVVGLASRTGRDLILRGQFVAQMLLGFAASALNPAMTLLSLWGLGEEPLVGWGSLWQWLVMATAGAICTPICFGAFDRFQRAFEYQRLPESSFRPDREIKRGRA